MANLKPKSYLQIDPKWKNIMYSITGDKKQTIGTSGCGPTCMAMAVNTLSNKNATPKTACAWAKENGYRTKNSGTLYSFFKSYGKKNGIEVTQLNGSNLQDMSKTNAKKYHNMAKKEIKAGNWVIGVMGPGLWTSSGHYILAYDLSGSNVLIRDPNSTASNKTKASWSKFTDQVKYYWVVNVKAAINVKNYKVKLTRKKGQPARKDAGAGYKNNKTLEYGQIVKITHHKYDKKNRLWGRTSDGWILMKKTKKVA